MRLTLVSLIALCALFAVNGCALVQDPDESYVKADAATFDAVAPEHLENVLEDYPLDSEDEFVAKQGQRRIRTTASWWRRLAASAQNLGVDLSEIKERLWATLDRLEIPTDDFERLTE